MEVLLLQSVCPDFDPGFPYHPIFRFLEGGHGVLFVLIVHGPWSPIHISTSDPVFPTNILHSWILTGRRRVPQLPVVHVSVLDPRFAEVLEECVLRGSVYSILPDTPESCLARVLNLVDSLKRHSTETSPFVKRVSNVSFAKS